MELKYIFAFGAIGLCILFMFFGVWQEIAKRNLTIRNLNPKSIGPFKDFPYEFWYVAVREPAKLKKMFTGNYDRLGRTYIFDHNHQQVGHIGRKTVYESKCIMNERSISSVPDIQDFTNFLRSLVFKDDQTGAEVFAFKPFDRGIQLNMDWKYVVAGKTYRLLSRPMLESFDAIVEIYEEGELVGRIARVSAKQFPMAVLNREIDPLSLIVTFDLFERYVS